MTDLRLTLPKNQRISTLAWAIWATGITPWSWSWQCGPEWVNIEGRAIDEAVEIFVRKNEHEMALEMEIERAESILRDQGRTLFPQPEDPA
jgi:hypothetical protein